MTGGSGSVVDISVYDENLILNILLSPSFLSFGNVCVCKYMLPYPYT